MLNWFQAIADRDSVKVPNGHISKHWQDVQFNGTKPTPSFPIAFQLGFVALNRFFGDVA
ncbi:hypothetical protein [Planktotalea sp.]|uniref:hypothetical protein n=1 Tax=Planktotalea sp. TaxID=2029877 RepID=UPI002600D141|nr:hypothetical protein [Planktotalea sp.]